MYCTSTVMTLWRRSVLLELLDPRETAWEFEIRGTERSESCDGFYVARKPTFDVINTIGRGRWSRRAIRRVRRLGVEPGLSARGIQTMAAEWKGRLMEFRSAPLRLLRPGTAAVSVMPSWDRPLGPIPLPARRPIKVGHPFSYEHS